MTRHEDALVQTNTQLMIINVPVKVAFVRKRNGGGRQVSSNVVHCLSFWEVIVIAWPTLVTTSMNGEPHFCSARCIFQNVVKIYTFSTKYFIHKMSTSVKLQPKRRHDVQIKGSFWNLRIGYVLQIKKSLATKWNRSPALQIYKTY